MNGATAAATRDGSFILGGYDRAIGTGQNYTAKIEPVSDTCPTGMVVTITGLSLNFPNGTESSLVPHSDVDFLACILPDWPFAVNMLYEPYYKTFEALTNTKSFDRSTGPYFGGELYHPGEAYVYPRILLQWPS